MKNLLLTDWAEANTALIIGIGALITVIVGFIVAVLRNETLRAAVVGRLINRVKGGQVVTVDDLKNHELKLKLKTYALTGLPKAITVIKDERKAELYNSYILLFTGIFAESIDNILATDFINMDEFQLKELLITQLAWRREQYAERFSKVLATRNNNLDAIKLVVTKLERWRAIECELITDNVLAVIGYGRFNSVINKLDIILNQYALGIDILIKNGAESFERLNGELDNFLNISQK